MLTREEEIAQAQQVVDVLQDWFLAIESGMANKRIPNLSFPRPTAKQADKLISVIDDFSSHEVKRHNGTYWASVGKDGVDYPDWHVTGRGVPIDMPADFNRLQGTARIAFAQDVYEKIKEVYGTYPGLSIS